MTERVDRLRQESLCAAPSLSAERAELMTRFYRENDGKHSVPVMRALAFKHLCQHKTLYIGADELIVGERGPAPKATPTFPELTCHSLEDLRILNSREKTAYAVETTALRVYEESVIPYWRGRSMRDRIFAQMEPKWLNAYEAGVFTEFMEQRAPGHTVADGKIYRKGMLDFKREIAEAIARHGDTGTRGRGDSPCPAFEQLRAMDIAAESVILFAERHAELAERMAAAESNFVRAAELRETADVCRWVPARAPRTFREALQMYWFCHLAVITELNGWDSFNPGRLDQHLIPFYRQGLADGTLTRESAKELLECFFIKFNNHPAPPKVGVTAEESGTYTDFANINLGGLMRDGADGVNEVSYLLLEVVEEMHLLQPSNNVQISRQTPDEFLKAAGRVIRRGYGFPSVFNADAVIQELLRQGKSLEDARDGGTSGCVEAGAFGKEAYVLTGYFNLVKLLELTLHDGFDVRTGKQLGPRTGDPRGYRSFDDLFAAWDRQVRHFVDLKMRGNQVIERLYAETMPAPFLSILIDDCIEKGLDYNAGGARYNTSYIQGVGIGTLTDSMAAIQTHVFGTTHPLVAPEDGTTHPPAPSRSGRGCTLLFAGGGSPLRVGEGPGEGFSMDCLLDALDSDFAGSERMRMGLLNKSPKYGNDDEAADEIMRRCFESFYCAVEGQPNARGGEYHIDMLPTTCHVYFGAVTGATPDGRRAGTPVSEGISPVQGADRLGPTAVLKSAGRMDHLRTGGTLLNMKFAPQVLAGEEGIEKLAHLIRAYFGMNGHHVQFNVVDADTLRAAQADPEAYRGLIVRVAGYSDYFCDLSRALQDEIIARTEHESL